LVGWLDEGLVDARVVTGVVTGVVARVVTGVEVTGATATGAEPELSSADERVCCTMAVKVSLAAEPGTVAGYMTARDDGVVVPGGARVRPVTVIVIAVGSVVSVHPTHVDVV